MGNDRFKFESMCENNDDIYDEIDNLSPDNYFSELKKDKLITLDI